MVLYRFGQFAVNGVKPDNQRGFFALYGAAKTVGKMVRHTSTILPFFCKKIFGTKNQTTIISKIILSKTDFFAGYDFGKLRKQEIKKNVAIRACHLPGSLFYNICFADSDACPLCSAQGCRQ
jgi:hypothetical protein